MDDIGLYHDSSRADDLSIRFREVRAATEGLAAKLIVQVASKLPGTSASSPSRSTTSAVPTASSGRTR